MRNALRLVLLALAPALAGCGAYSAPPVALYGQPSDLQNLRGAWHGSFRNTELGRTGRIEFHMNADSDSAFGEVNMYAMAPTQPIWSRPAAANSTNLTPAPTWLRIRFVRVEGGSVSGSMEPYWDPKCNCEVTAHFLGRLHGDRMTGSYTARNETNHYETSGSWNVERAPEPAK